LESFLAGPAAKKDPKGELKGFHNITGSDLIERREQIQRRLKWVRKESE
jgi:hypothetical protein